MERARKTQSLFTFEGTTGLPFLQMILNQCIRLYWTNPPIFVRPFFVVAWTENYAIVYHIFTFTFHVILLQFLFLTLDQSMENRLGK